MAKWKAFPLMYILLSYQTVASSLTCKSPLLNKPKDTRSWAFTELSQPSSILFSSVSKSAAKIFHLSTLEAVFQPEDNKTTQGCRLTASQAQGSRTCKCIWRYLQKRGKVVSIWIFFLTVPNGHFKFTRMSFGLRKRPKSMNGCCADSLWWMAE